MHEEQGFLEELREHPEDDVTRLVYADWLDERGDVRAAYLRAEVALARMTQGDVGYADAEAELAFLGEDIEQGWLEQAGKRWDVVLHRIDRARIIQAIKLVREATGEGLFRAKCRVENLPSVLVFNSSRAKVEDTRRVFDRDTIGGLPGGGARRVSIEPTRADDGYQLLVIYQHGAETDRNAVSAWDAGYGRLAEVIGRSVDRHGPRNGAFPWNFVDRATASQVAACLDCRIPQIELIVRLAPDLPSS